MHPLPLGGAVVLVVLLIWRWRRIVLPLRLAGIALAAVLVAYGVGLIPKPDIEKILLDIGGTLGNWTYLVVGAFAFLETGAFVGLVAPGETAIIAGGIIAGQGVIEYVPLMLLVWSCCVAGDVCSYWIGRRLGRGFMVRHGSKVKITEERLEQVERFFARRGGVTILVGRWVGLVRAVAPFVAGASRMPFRRFLAYDVVGCGLWGPAYVTLGYVSWRNIDRAATIASRGSLVAGTVIAVVVAVIVLRQRLRHNQART